MKKNLLEGNRYTRELINDINFGVKTKVDVADMLGISRPTLDERIKSDRWKKSELACIKILYLI